jgi:hypothetical protein
VQWLVYVTWSEPDGGQPCMKCVVPQNESMSEIMCNMWQEQKAQEPRLLTSSFILCNLVFSWPLALFCTLNPVLHVCYLIVYVAASVCIETWDRFLVCFWSHALWAGGASGRRSAGYALPHRGHCFAFQLTRQGLWHSQVPVQSSTSPAGACSAYQYERCWRCWTYK